MKLTVILLFVSLLAVGKPIYSQNKKLTLSTENSSLIDIFRQIEDQSEFYFYFNKDEVKSVEHLSVEMNNVSVNDILDHVLIGTGLEYKIIDRYVVIKKKGAADTAVIFQGEEKKITGKVTDQRGAPLGGVSVILKGTTTGVITDSEGQYSLKNVPADGTLVFLDIPVMLTPSSGHIDPHQG